MPWAAAHCSARHGFADMRLGVRAVPLLHLRRRSLALPALGLWCGPTCGSPWLLSSALCSLHTTLLACTLRGAGCVSSCWLVCNALHQSCANNTAAQNRILIDCPAVLCTHSSSAKLRARGLCVERVTNTCCVSEPVGSAWQAGRGWTTATRGTTAARTRRRAGCARSGWRATPRSRPGARARSRRACRQAPRPSGPCPRRRARCRHARCRHARCRRVPCARLCCTHATDLPATTADLPYDVLRPEVGPGQGSAGGASACQATGACARPRPVLACGPVLMSWGRPCCRRPVLCCLRRTP